MLLAAALLSLAAAAPPADAVLLECERGAAEFEARMEALPGAERMSMRFTLQAQKHRRFRRIEAPGFDEWTTADPGVTRYVYTRRVEELIGPARYRVRVRFRWDGETIVRARRYSRACRQPDPRPDLVIDELSYEGGRFAALVRNRGREAAGPFAVRIGAAEAALDGLGARRERRIEVDGPCEGSATAEADPHDEVEERSERNNDLAVECPD